jgi:hypothetical protein
MWAAMFSGTSERYRDTSGLKLMRADEIQWQRSDSAISEEQIAEVERALGIRFPDDYRSLIPHCHGGHPVPVDYLESIGTGLTRC